MRGEKKRNTDAKTEILATQQKSPPVQTIVVPTVLLTSSNSNYQKGMFVCGRGRDRVIVCDPVLYLGPAFAFSLLFPLDDSDLYG